MLAIIKQPGEPAKRIEIDNTLEALQRAVGGYIETVSIFTVDIKGYYRRRYYVYCPHCGKESIRMETRTKAIKTWNYGQEGDS